MGQLLKLLGSRVVIEIAQAKLPVDLHGALEMRQRRREFEHLRGPGRFRAGRFAAKIVAENWSSARKFTVTVESPISALRHQSL